MDRLALIGINRAIGSPRRVTVISPSASSKRSRWDKDWRVSRIVSFFISGSPVITLCGSRKLGCVTFLLNVAHSNSQGNMKKFTFGLLTRGFDQKKDGDLDPKPQSFVGVSRVRNSMNFHDSRWPAEALAQAGVPAGHGHLLMNHEWSLAHPHYSICTKPKVQETWSGLLERIHRPPLLNKNHQRSLPD
jgi:hypothetical protein